MPNARIHSTRAHVRVSNFQTGVLSEETSSSTTITAGTPLGLLLALTYATDQVVAGTTLTYRGDYRPNVRISNV